MQGCGRKENSALLEAINDKHKAFLINTGNLAPSFDESTNSQSKRMLQLKVDIVKDFILKAALPH